MGSCLWVERCLGEHGTGGERWEQSYSGDRQIKSETENQVCKTRTAKYRCPSPQDTEERDFLMVIICQVLEGTINFYLLSSSHLSFSVFLLFWSIILSVNVFLLSAFDHLPLEQPCSTCRTAALAGQSIFHHGKPSAKL